MFLTHISAAVGNVSVVIDDNIHPTFDQRANEAMLEIIDFLEFEVDGDVQKQIKDTVLKCLNHAIMVER